MNRIDEIRARLDARTSTMPGSNERMVWDSGRSYHVEDDRDRASQAFHLHAPADIAWLLDEVERLHEAEKNRERLSAKLRDYMNSRDCNDEC